MGEPVTALAITPLGGVLFLAGWLVLAGWTLVGCADAPAPPAAEAVPPASLGVDVERRMVVGVERAQVLTVARRELASYFDPSLLRVVRHLTRSNAQRFSTWTTLVNAAAAP